MGSVKDLVVLKKPEGELPGEGIFVFSDRYSVFDWGEMPDHIPHKGESLCTISAFFFEKLEEMGVSTHYLGVHANGETPVRLSQLESPPSKMKIKLVRVIEPEFKDGKYDYSAFKEVKTNYLIPLEVIYRFSLPKGSSVFKRLEEGSIKPEDMGLSRMPEPGTELEKPFIDFSTKLEHYDRYLNREEAREISGLSEERFEELERLAEKLAYLIKESYEEIGIKNEDGKFEFAVDENGSIMVVDTLGTPDECRFSKDSVTISKEFARIFYRGSKWHEEVEEAKKKYGKDWREKVSMQPEKLPPETLELLSNIYTSLTNALLNKEIFSGVPDLEEVIKRIAKAV